MSLSGSLNTNFQSPARNIRDIFNTVVKINYSTVVFINVGIKCMVYFV